MKVAHAIRAAMLAIALIVMLAPVPYLAREEPGGGSGHHEHLTFVQTARAIPLERAVIAWWIACALVLAWAEYARRTARTDGAGRALRWMIVLAASVLEFVRSIGTSTDHVDRLQGAGVIDLAALVYLIAMIAGTIAVLAEPEP